MNIGKNKRFQVKPDCLLPLAIKNIKNIIHVYRYSSRQIFESFDAFPSFSSLQMKHSTYSFIIVLFSRSWGFSLKSA
jgi:hypothetical protein